MYKKTMLENGLRIISVSLPHAHSACIATVTNRDGEEVLRGEATVYQAERAHRN